MSQLILMVALLLTVGCGKECVLVPWDPPTEEPRAPPLGDPGFAPGPEVIVYANLFGIEVDQRIYAARVRLIAGADTFTVLTNRDGIAEFQNIPARAVYQLDAESIGYFARVDTIVIEGSGIYVYDVPMHARALTPPLAIQQCRRTII